MKLIYAFLILFIFILFSFPFLIPGHIVFGDIDFGFYLNGYIERIVSLWNYLWSTPTFFNGTRLPFVYPVYEFFLNFDNNASYFEKSIIFFLLLSSAFSMFILSNYIIHNSFKKNQVPNKSILFFLISIFSGIFYAYNPWSIIRIQHIYLLVGYALLPLIFYSVLKFTQEDNVLKNISFKSIISFTYLKWIFFTSFLYAIAIGAVHYLFFVAIIIGFWYFYRLIYFLLKGYSKHLIIITARYFIWGILFLLLISYWLLPYLASSLIANVNPPSINTVDSISSLARYAYFNYVLYLVSYWWPMIDIGSFSNSFWIGGAILLFIIFFFNLINIKNKYSLFFLFLALFLILFSTGTKYPYFGDFYKWLVFDNPVAGKMGFIFRDSNKLVGLLAFVFSILLAIGLAKLSVLLFHFYNNQKDKKLLFTYKNTFHIIYMCTFIITILSYIFYIYPFFKIYLWHYYKPINIPSSYKNLFLYQENDNSTGKYLYLPRYETAVSPGYSFLVTKWNYSSGTVYQRPTSSIDINSTFKPTYHPLEGASIYVNYVYDYLQEYLYNGIGYNLSNYLSLLGVSKLVYHKDFYGLEEYQNKQIKNLEKQKNITIDEKFGFIRIYKNLFTNSYLTLYNKNLFIFGGINKLESLFNLGLDYKSYAYIFSDKYFGLINNYKTGDLIVSDNIYDILISKLNDKNFIIPFDKVNYSDPFLRWAKTRVDTLEWRYHLSKLGIDNFDWGFDFTKGFIFTYTAWKFNIQPYDNLEKIGKVIFNLISNEDYSSLIKTYDESNLKLEIKKTKNLDIPSIKGEVAIGNDKVWKVASLKPISIYDNLAYYVKFLVSGKDLQNFHIKIKFFDDNDNELGVSYVSAPRQADTFTKIKFTNYFVPPVGAKKMIIYINSLKNPKYKSYWYIHNIIIKSFPNKTKKNKILLKNNFKKKGDYILFARAFKNQKGGKIKISIGNKEFYLDTSSISKNLFTWYNLGEIKITKTGEYNIVVDNLKGFNALNLIAFYPKKDYLENKKKLINYNQLLVLESENYSNFSGDIQTKDFNINYSNGKSVNFNSGYVEYNFDIVNDKVYSLLLFLNKLSLHKNTYNITLLKDNKLIYSKKYFANRKKIHLASLIKGKGTYKLNIQIKDNSKSLIKRLRRFNDDKDLFNFSGTFYYKAQDTFIEELKKIKGINPYTDGNIKYLRDDRGCTYFYGLYNKDIKYTYYKNKTYLYLRRGFSCYWLISTHDIIPVNENEKYIFNFKFYKKNTKKLHIKVRFLDKDKNDLKIDTYRFNNTINNSNVIEDLDFDYPDDKWIKFSSIIDVPENAKYMQIQFWQRQRQDTDSYLIIKNLVLKNYNELAGVDFVFIYPKSLDYLNKTQKLDYNISYNKTNSRNIYFSIKNLEFNNTNYKLTNKTVYFRAYPNIYSNVIGTLMSGTLVKIISKKKYFSKVYTLEYGTGYISNIALKLGKDKKYSNGNNLIVVLNESFTKLWKIKLDSGYKEGIIGNLFVNLFDISNIREYKSINISFISEKYMYIGYKITLFAIMLIVIYLFLYLFYLIYENKNKK